MHLHVIVISNQACVMLIIKLKTTQNHLCSMETIHYWENKNALIQKESGQLQQNSSENVCPHWVKEAKQNYKEKRSVSSLKSKMWCKLENEQEKKELKIYTSLILTKRI